MKINLLLEHLNGISGSLENQTLKESFISTISSLKKEFEKMGKDIDSSQKRIKKMERELIEIGDEIKRHDLFGQPSSLEEVLKIELLSEIYKKFSLENIEERFGTKNNLDL